MQKRCVFCYIVYIRENAYGLYNVHSTEWHLSRPRVLHAHYARNLTRARVKSATSAASTYFAYECVLHIAIYTFDRLAYGREEGRKVARTGDKEDGSVTLPPSCLRNFKYPRFLFPQSRDFRRSRLRALVTLPPPPRERA